MNEKQIKMEIELESLEQYKKVLDKCNFSVSKLKDVNRSYKVILTTERYEKLGRKCFPKKPTNVEVEEINAWQLGCYFTGIGFFKDRIEKSYTPLGYVATKLTCVNPDDSIKIVRKFKYIYEPNTI